jgi:8-oxo-dGTP diphosphatase
MIYKVGAIILNKRSELLVTRKAVQGRHTFIIPGGRREGDESDGETCIRELREELGVEVQSLTYFDTYREMAEFEGIPLVMPVFRAEIAGNPKPMSEILEVAWIKTTYREDGFEVGSTLANGVIPALISLGLLS